MFGVFAFPLLSGLKFLKSLEISETLGELSEIAWFPGCEASSFLLSAAEEGKDMSQ